MTVKVTTMNNTIEPSTQLQGVPAVSPDEDILVLALRARHHSYWRVPISGPTAKQTYNKRGQQPVNQLRARCQAQMTVKVTTMNNTIEPSTQLQGVPAVSPDDDIFVCKLTTVNHDSMGEHPSQNLQQNKHAHRVQPNGAGAQQLLASTIAQNERRLF